MKGDKRRKKQRLSSQDEEAARRKFLEALEAQRAKARIQQTTETRSEDKGSSPSPAVSLRGFYYDEAKRRYFRCCPTFAQPRRKELEMQQETTLRKSERHVKTCRLKYGITSHNWVTYLSQRQCDLRWSGHCRDRQELMPQLLSGYLSSQVVEYQAMDINSDQFTALALPPQARHVVALGAGSGRLDILQVQRQAHDPLSAKSSRILHPIRAFNCGGLITSLQWRPVQDLDLLVCHLGSGQRRNVTTPSGNVYFLRRGGQETSEIMKCVDPWTVKWNPTETNKFSIGCGGSMSAAYVDVASTTSGFQRAPAGALTSDVHAQSFFNSGHIVLNGTKSGGLWAWDVRSPRRVFEWNPKSKASQATGSIVDIHMLADSRRAVIQRSSGELRIVDLRTFRPVVEFMPGASKRYLPNLRCAIDKYESVVVSGGDFQHPLTVNSFDLRNGHLVASVEVQRAQRRAETSPPQLVQQVQVVSAQDGSSNEDIPDIWALSRNELYASNGRTKR